MKRLWKLLKIKLHPELAPEVPSGRCDVCHRWFERWCGRVEIAGEEEKWTCMECCKGG